MDEATRQKLIDFGKMLRILKIVPPDVQRYSRYTTNEINVNQQITTTLPDSVVCDFWGYLDKSNKPTPTTRLTNYDVLRPAAPPAIKRRHRIIHENTGNVRLTVAHTCGDDFITVNRQQVIDHLTQAVRVRVYWRETDNSVVGQFCPAK